MVDDDTGAMRVRWARLRFSIIGPLLSAPPETGDLLCAYGARGAVASSRLSELLDGRFAYDMKRPLPDGRRQLVMTGVELLEKLVPLIPPTYANLTRFITAR